MRPLQDDPRFRKSCPRPFRAAAIHRVTCVLLLLACLGAPGGSVWAQETPALPATAAELPAATQPSATAPAQPDSEPSAAAESAPSSLPSAATEPTTEPSTQALSQPASQATTKPSTQPEIATRPRTMPAGDGLLLNFKDASVQAVLEYLSEAAGLVILNGTRVDGRVDIMSRQRITVEEAVALLDTVLREKGYAAIHTERTLKIVPVDQAVRENLPVYSGNDPSKVPMTDRLVTQVIPIQSANATRLRADLAPMIGTGATFTANEASNSLILIDTQTNIRRIMRIIRALDENLAGAAEVKVFQLEYANASNAAKLITELFKQDQTRTGQTQMPFFTRGRGGPGQPSRGQGEEAAGRQQKVTASSDDRTNTLVVSAPPDLMKVIEGIVKELDSNPSAEQAVFIYPLKNAQAANLQTVLNNIFSETSGTTAGGARSQTQGRRGFTFGLTQTVASSASDLVGQVYVVADEDTNSLLVRTSTKHFDRVKQIIAELDRPIRQVLIKVLIAEVTHDEELDLGTQFSALNLQFGTTGTLTLDVGTDERSGGVVTSTLNAGLSATFNALHRMGKLDVLSRPYVLASDNQEAKITVGQEVPFITNSRTTETGQTINTITYEDIGIILSVTPHVNPEGIVIMDVAPEISTLTETTVPISETVNATVIAKRSASTRVAIRDGQTIVIGGLMEDRIIDGVRKVPFLGDIPILGALFRQKTQSKVKTELLIFLTPRVAKLPEELKSISETEEKSSEAVQGAVESGTFDKHMRAMHRAPTSRPAGDANEAPR